MSPKKYFSTNLGELWVGDCLKVIEQFDKKIDLIITSPPYYQQRQYLDKDDPASQNELGWEPSPQAYVDSLVELFTEIRTKMNKTGVLFINIGDKYINKQMALIPEMFAFAMKKAGFYLRNTLIWKKLSFMPTKSEDRFIYAHEPIFFFSINPGDYYFRKLSNLEEFYNYRSSVWDLPINKTNDIENHFAPFPEELVEVILKWACPEKICLQCGQAYMPVYEQFVTKGEENKTSKVIGSVEKHNPLGKTSMFRNKDVKIERYFKEHRPSCTCKAKTQTGLVYDPFMGSGTVADVCESKTIRWAGSELGKDFAKLIKDRVLHHKDGIKIPKIPQNKNGGLLQWDKLNLGKRVLVKKD